MPLQPYPVPPGQQPCACPGNMHSPVLCDLSSPTTCHHPRSLDSQSQPCLASQATHLSSHIIPLGVSRCCGWRLRLLSPSRSPPTTPAAPPLSSSCCWSERRGDSSLWPEQEVCRGLEEFRAWSPGPSWVLSTDFRGLWLAAACRELSSAALRQAHLHCPISEHCLHNVLQIQVVLQI